MEPLHALSLAAAVVRFTKVGETLILFASRIEQGESLHQADFRQLSTLLNDLREVSAISVSCHIAPDRNDTTETPEESLKRLATQAQQNAAFVYRQLSPIEHVEKGFPKDPSLDTDYIRTSHKSPELAKELTRRFTRLMDACLTSATNAFVELWTIDNLLTRLTCLSQHCQELNPFLLRITNAAIATDTASREKDDRAKAYTLTEGDEVTEILSINCQQGLQPVAALLVTRTGDSIVISPKDSSNHGNLPYGDCNVIRYDTTSRVKQTPFLDAKPVSDLATAANTYGNTAISGSGTTHLGDTNFSAPINIHQLVLVNGQQDQTPIQASPVSKDLPPFDSTTANRSADTDVVFDKYLPMIRLHQDLKYIEVRSADSVVQRMKNALYYREESYRMAEVKGPHRRTFGWIFCPSESASQHDFPGWLESGNQCFWINGKAGSGKSTLMKYIFQSTRTQTHLAKWAKDRELVVTTHFFWHLGTILQKSHEGVMRSLILQILNKRAELAHVLFPKIYMRLLGESEHASHQFTASELQDALDTLIRRFPKDMVLFIMIDGVDEYSGGYYEFCKLLVRLTANPAIKVLVSSRPIPACHHVFSGCPMLRVQDLTVRDIRHYVEEELINDNLLQEMNALYPGFAEQVNQELTSKASGVFLWIILVVRDLLIGLGNYDDPDTLMWKINRLPNDLEDLYDHMFAKMSPEYQHEGSILLQLTKRALEVQQSEYTAVQAWFADPVCSRSAQAEARLDTKGFKFACVKAVDGRLRSRCCGLVEVQYQSAGASKEPRVNFLHRTVAEYLNNYGIWGKVQALKAWTDTDIDLVLLESCLQTLRCYSQVVHSTSTGHQTTLLRECFRYSQQISKKGSNDYADWLYSADQIMLKSCMNEGWAGLEAYNKFYKGLISRFDTDRLSLPENKYRTNDDAVKHFMILVATHELPVFWRLKIRDLSSSERARALLAMIDVVRLNSDKSNAKYFKNLAALLENANPNEIVVDHEVSLHTGAISLAMLSHEEGTAMVPWHFWLAVRERGRSLFNWKLTLLFMMAGAQLKSDHIPMKNALRALFDDASLVRREIDCPQPEEIEILDQIILLMEQATQATQTSSDSYLQTSVDWVSGSLLDPLKKLGFW